MKFAELAPLTDEQLIHKEMELERVLLGHQFRHRTGRLENTSLLAKARKDIARAQTEIRRREDEAGFTKGSLRSKHCGSFVPAVVAAEPAAGGGFLDKMLDGQPAPE